MKIYLAGNIPHREREEQELADKGLSQKWLFSYFFILWDGSMRKLFEQVKMRTLKK